MAADHRSSQTACRGSTPTAIWSGTTIYANPDDSQVIRINLTVKAADPDGACRGQNNSAGSKDYSGCALEDLIGAYDDRGDRGDNDSKDDFDPELSATAVIRAKG